MPSKSPKISLLELSAQFLIGSPGTLMPRLMHEGQIRPGQRQLSQLSLQRRPRRKSQSPSIGKEEVDALDWRMRSLEEKIYETSDILQRKHEGQTLEGNQLTKVGR